MQEPTKNEEQIDTPQPGTSSGAATQIDTWNNGISVQNGLIIQAEMEVEVDDPRAEKQPKSDKQIKSGGITKAKNWIKGKIIFDMVAFPELLHKLLDGKLVVKTKLGNTAFQWVANSDQPDQDGSPESPEIAKESKNQGKGSKNPKKSNTSSATPASQAQHH